MAFLSSIAFAIARAVAFEMAFVGRAIGVPLFV